MEINEELKKKMVEYLDQLETNLKSVKDFGAEQVPLLVQEYLNWLFWSNIGLTIIGAMIFTTIIIGAFKVYKFCRQTDDRVMTIILSGVVSVVGLIPFFTGIHNAAKVHIAPRVVILEEVTNLVKDIK